MRQHVTKALRIALLYGGQSVIGWSQTPVPSVAAAPATPTVEVVASPNGATVQAATEGFGSMNLGHISWASQNTQFGLTHTKDGTSFTIATSLGLRLDCPVVDSGRRASITAGLQQVDPRYTVSLDQITLSTAPTMITSLVACGATTQHTLQVRVPVTASAGPIDANVNFQVTLQ
ncbi:MAG TPA: hypothetical protein VK419_08640 [Bryobacteraceae bacterium]|nr:hypothetical protein [Bryobacteraceae bacterium]